MTEQTSIINWKSVATTVVSFGAAVYGASLAEDIKDAIISSSKSFATALESSNDTAEDAGTPAATPKRKRKREDDKEENRATEKVLKMSPVKVAHPDVVDETQHLQKKLIALEKENVSLKKRIKEFEDDAEDDKFSPGDMVLVTGEEEVRGVSTVVYWPARVTGKTTRRRGEKCVMVRYLRSFENDLKSEVTEEVKKEVGELYQRLQEKKLFVFYERAHYIHQFRSALVDIETMTIIAREKVTKLLKWDELDAPGNSKNKTNELFQIDISKSSV